MLDIVDMAIAVLLIVGLGLGLLPRRERERCVPYDHQNREEGEAEH